VLTGPRAGARLTLRERLSIGRGRAADVVVPDPEASRVHARVRLGADGATVEDLGSKNGVRLNGVRVERGPQPLRPGDEFTIGETLLRLADPLEALARRPTAGDPSPTSPRRRRTFAPEIAAAALLALSAAALALAS
jgi:pSer/pThr/pTyr-binding forkhead associated (FHA) protein